MDFLAPCYVATYVRRHGAKRAYWHLRYLGFTRYQTLRAFFFAL